MEITQNILHKDGSIHCPIKCEQEAVNKMKAEG
jgi:hypothetical protein